MMAPPVRPSTPPRASGEARAGAGRRARAPTLAPPQIPHVPTVMFDYRPVGYIIGWLVAGLGMFMSLPMVLDIIDGDGNWHAFMVSLLLTTAAGGSVALACEDRRDRNLSLKQGFLLTAGAWMVLPAFSALPLMIGVPYLGVTDAYFESMSAMTTTGGTVIVGLDDLPRSILLWRGLLQWIGGMGVVLMAMLLLPALNIGGMQLLRTSDFNTLGKVLPRAEEIARSIGGVYVVLTLGCMLGYAWSGMDGFDAVVHAMTTLSSGGMGTRDSSFGTFSPAAQYVSTVFMLLAAVSFVRFVQVSRGNPGALFSDTQVRAYFAVFAGFSLAIILARLLAKEPLTEMLVREVLFNTASVISSTGYATTDFALWSPLATVLFFCLMMIGGCSGSTGGGVKIFRYQILASTISARIKQLYSPSMVVVPRYEGRRISPEVLDSVIAFFMMFFITLGVVSVLLVLLGLDPTTAITGAATALANVGPGLGPIIGPAGNFASLPDAAKWVLSATMLLGRLELMAVYVLFTAAFWRT